MTKQELVSECFGYLNSFKRHRALLEIKPHDKQYHELQMYKMVDRLEVGLRAIQKEIRDSGGVQSDESSD